MSFCADALPPPRPAGSPRQKLFWIGSPFFSGSLPDWGWEVHVHNFEQLAVFGWDDLVHLAGWEPDVVVVADKSRPPFVLGMETFPCITIFYAVDSHIHTWYPWYAQGFDACIMSLKDHLPLMENRRLPRERLLWFPAFAPDSTECAKAPPESPCWDCLFVGTVDAGRTPRRKAFLERLQQRIPIAIMRGDYRALYPRARVVLNYCELGDLNFRVFEALGCRACLVTPEVQHGFADLFTPGEHLLTYAPDDVDAAERAIRKALAKPDLRAHLADAGFAAVEARHRARHRAEAFSAFIRDFPTYVVAERLAKAPAIRKKWLKWLYLIEAEQWQSPLLRKAYLDAAMGRFKGGVR